MQRDGDIIRALGYVALYAAYLEEGVDRVMERLSCVKRITTADRKLPASRKISWCIDVLKSLKPSELDEVIRNLKAASRLLELRNEIIHGRIYAGNDRGDNLKSGRIGVPDRKVTADELCDLAQSLFSLQSELPNAGCIATIQAISKRNKKVK